MNYRNEIYFEAEPDRELPFPKDEYTNRLNRIRQAMQQADIDCLFLTSPESMYYLSGYMCMWYQTESPFEWPPSNGFAVHVDHDGFIHFETEREAYLTRMFSVEGDTRYFPKDSYRDGTGFVCDQLKQEGWLNGKIGLEFWAMRPNRAISEQLQLRLEAEGATVVDGSHILREVRWIKSSAEMICLEEAARIATVGLKSAQQHIAEGVTELEVQGEVIRAMTATGGELQGMMMPVLSGKKSNATHGISTLKKIQKGEVVTLDLSGVHKRYHINGARTYHVGKPNAKLLDVAKRAAGAMHVAVDCLRPNLPVRELNERVKAYYDKEGIWDSRGWVGGYEMGISFFSDWVGNFVYDPMAEKNSDRIFEPNTAVNYEIQVFLPDHVGAFFMVESFLFYEDHVVKATAKYALFTDSLWNNSYSKYNHDGTGSSGNRLFFFATGYRFISAKAGN